MPTKWYQADLHVLLCLNSFMLNVTKPLINKYNARYLKARYCNAFNIWLQVDPRAGHMHVHLVYDILCSDEGNTDYETLFSPFVYTYQLYAEIEGTLAFPGKRISIFAQHTTVIPFHQRFVQIFNFQRNIPTTSFLFNIFDELLL